ncbi:MAG: hypothetical protein ACOY3Y_10125 [Acidobacteriota bacterium]
MKETTPSNESKTTLSSKPPRAITALIIAWPLTIAVIGAGVYQRDRQVEAAMIVACSSAHKVAGDCARSTGESQVGEDCLMIVNRLQSKQQQPTCCLRGATDVFKCIERVQKTECRLNALELCAEARVYCHPQCDDTGWYQ